MKQLAFFFTNPSRLSWKIISWLSDQTFNANHLIFTGYGISTLIMLENNVLGSWFFYLFGFVVAALKYGWMQCPHTSKVLGWMNVSGWMNVNPLCCFVLSCEGFRRSAEARAILARSNGMEDSAMAMGPIGHRSCCGRETEFQ
jgi:hypothetical protein